jgi:hypothetical protein
MENKTSTINHENGNEANRLLADSICEHVYEEVEHGFGNTCLRCVKCGEIAD